MSKKLIIIISICLFFSLPAYAVRLPGKISKKQGKLVYTIKSGDTFYHLANRLDIPVSRLQALNPETDPRQLQIGSQLEITTRQDSYQVQPGDSLWEISRRFQLHPLAVKEANLVSDPDSIYPGELIILPTEIKTRLYFTKFTTTEAYLVAETRQLDTDKHPYITALQELINGPTKSKGTYCPLPDKTEIKGIRVADGIAHVNFGPQLRRANVGSIGEHLLLLALANTLTEFKGIKGVKLLVEGRQLETIGGHIVLDQPLRRSLKPVKAEY